MKEYPTVNKTKRHAVLRDRRCGIVFIVSKCDGYNTEWYELLFESDSFTETQKVWSENQNFGRVVQPINPSSRT